MGVTVVAAPSRRDRWPHTVRMEPRAHRPGHAGSGQVRPDAVGDWSFTLEAWGSPWDTWRARAGHQDPRRSRRRRRAEGGLARWLRASPAQGRRRPPTIARPARRAARHPGGRMPSWLRSGWPQAPIPPSPPIMHRAPAARGRSRRSGPWPLRVQRRRRARRCLAPVLPAQRGSDPGPRRARAPAPPRWRALDAVAAMGFDVVYLPPVHPIGRINRKGPNNTAHPGPDDPGSPWAIGSAEGGHDAVHPDLGTLRRLRRASSRAPATSGWRSRSTSRCRRRRTTRG